MKSIAPLGLLVLAVCTGCDPATGVIRTVRLTNAPPNQIIESALRSVPGIKDFEYRSRQGADTWSAGGGMLVLEIRQLRKGERILEMRYLHFGSSTLGELDRPRRLMDQVYTSLCREAPSLPPATQVSEKLIRVRND